jgi:hypothetical protein
MAALENKTIIARSQARQLFDVMSEQERQKLVDGYIKFQDVIPQGNLKDLIIRELKGYVLDWAIFGD